MELRSSVALTSNKLAQYIRSNALNRVHAHTSSRLCFV